MKKQKNKLAIYQAKSGAIEIRTDVKNVTVWLTKNDLSIIFERDQSVISRHLKNIFKDGEVDKKSNMQKMHIASSDKPVEFYSLDIILAIGYRINSARAIDFRKWSTKILKQHITKGYTTNKKVLKKNYQEFLQAVDDIKFLAKDNKKIKSDDILEFIKTLFNLINLTLGIKIFQLKKFQLKKL